MWHWHTLHYVPLAHLTPYVMLCYKTQLCHSIIESVPCYATAMRQINIEKNCAKIIIIGMYDINDGQTSYL